MRVHIAIFSSIVACLLLFNTVTAAPPSQDEVNVYSSLCKIGKLKDYELNLEMGLIGRRLIAGGGKFSNKDLQQEFPGIKDEKNRLLALEAYQDCMYQYVTRFHPAVSSEASASKVPSDTVFSPTVPIERKREIIFLANELENFKNQMENMKSALPDNYYDKRDSKEKYPKKDQRIIDLDNYKRYKAFQTPSGVPNFSNMSNNDIVLFCDAYSNEVNSYYYFQREFGKVLGLQPYKQSPEVKRICKASKRGR